MISFGSCQISVNGVQIRSVADSQTVVMEATTSRETSSALRVGTRWRRTRHDVEEGYEVRKSVILPLEIKQMTALGIHNFIYILYISHVYNTTAPDPRAVPIYTYTWMWATNVGISSSRSADFIETTIVVAELIRGNMKAWIMWLYYMRVSERYAYNIKSRGRVVSWRHQI